LSDASFSICRAEAGRPGCPRLHLKRVMPGGPHATTMTSTRRGFTTCSGAASASPSSSQAPQPVTPPGPPRPPGTP